MLGVRHPHGEPRYQRLPPALTVAWSIIMQDLIWIGIAAGLALLSLLYVSLADRA